MSAQSYRRNCAWCGRMLSIPQVRAGVETCNRACAVQRAASEELGIEGGYRYFAHPDGNVYEERDGRIRVYDRRSNWEQTRAYYRLTHPRKTVDTWLEERRVPETLAGEKL